MDSLDSMSDASPTNTMSDDITLHLKSEMENLHEGMEDAKLEMIKVKTEMMKITDENRTMQVTADVLEQEMKVKNRELSKLNIEKAEFGSGGDNLRQYGTDPTSKEDILNSCTKMVQLINTYEKRITDLENQKSGLQHLCNFHSDEHRKTIAKVNIKNDGIKQLQEDNTTLQLENDTLRQIGAAMQVDIKDRDVEIQKFSDRISSFTKERKELNQKIQQQADKYYSSQSEIEKKKNIIITKTNEITKLSDRIEKMIDYETRLKMDQAKQVDILAQRITNLQELLTNKRDEANEEIRGHKSITAAANDKLDALEQHVAQFENEKHRYKQKIHNIEVENVDLHERLSKMAHELNNSEANIRSLSDKMQAAEHTVATQKVAYDAILDSENRLRGQYDVIYKENEEQKVQNEELIDQVQNFRDEIHDLNLKIDDITKVNFELQDTIDMREVAFAQQLDEQNMDLQTHTANLEIAMDAMKEEMASLQSKNSDLTNEKARLNNSIRDYVKTIDMNKKELKGKRDELHSLQRKFRSGQGRIEQEKLKTEKLQEHYNNLLAKSNELKKQFNEKVGECLEQDRSAQSLKRYYDEQEFKLASAEQQVQQNVKLIRDMELSHEDEIRVLHGEMDTQNEVNKQLMEQIEADKSKLTSDKELIELELARMKDQVSMCKIEIMELTTSKANIQEQYYTEKNNKMDSERKIRDNEQLIASLQREITKQQKKMDTQDRKTREYIQKIGRHKSTIDTLKNDKKDLERTVNQNRITSMQQEKMITERNRQCDEKDIQMDTIKKSYEIKIRDFQFENENKDDTIFELNAKLETFKDDFDRETEKLEMINQELTDKNADIQDKLSEKKRMIEQNQTLMTEFSNNKSKDQDEIRDLTQNLVRATASMKELQSRLESKDNEIRSYKDTIDRQRGEMTTNKKSSIELSSMVEEKVDMVAKLDKKLVACRKENDMLVAKLEKVRTGLQEQISMANDDLEAQDKDYNEQLDRLKGQMAMKNRQLDSQKRQLDQLNDNVNNHNEQTNAHFQIMQEKDDEIKRLSDEIKQNKQLIQLQDKLSAIHKQELTALNDKLLLQQSQAKELDYFAANNPAETGMGSTATFGYPK